MCLGVNDIARDLAGDSFQGAQCSDAFAQTVGLVAPDRCGVHPCCPVLPFTPTGCTDKLDDRLGIVGQCRDMVASGIYSCEADFCPSCGILAGECDKTCRYGECAICGDCWRESRLSLTAPERCDDGNVLDGDGCSSSCEVEQGWTCTTNTSLGFKIDRCVRCNDLPTNWADVQGYTCEDYRFFSACDSSSLSTDPVVPGGGRFVTPESFYYRSVYDIEVQQKKPLKLLVSVTASSNAHIFFGKPREKGLEAVIGGWDNSLSVLRVYPTTQTLDQFYGQVLNRTEVRQFWVYLDINGTFMLGRGTNFFSDTFLDASHMTRQIHQESGWVDHAAGRSSLDHVWVSTGWRSTGKWEISLLDGSASPTLRELAPLNGADASKACCVCGGGVMGRPCELQMSGVISGSRTDIPGSAATGRRLPEKARQLGIGDFDGLPFFIGPPVQEGFSMQIKLRGCDTLAAQCRLHAIVVLDRAKSRVVAPLEQVWTQLRVPTCRLRNHVQIGSELRWKATNCGMDEGNEYVVALQLKSLGGETPLLLVDFKVPSRPSQQVQSVELDDMDPRPGYLAGKALIQGVQEERDILQYRLYFGRNNNTKVNFISDGNAALVAWVNTFGGGGLRNGYDNDCLYGDCAWNAQLTLSPGNGQQFGQYIIRHSETNDCLCYTSKILETKACTSDLLQLDAPRAYKYEVVGNGALVDAQDLMYRTVQYKDVGPGRNYSNESSGTWEMPSSEELLEVLRIVEPVCSDLAACVGIMISERTLDAAIMLDASFSFEQLPSGGWKEPTMHPLLVAEGAEQRHLINVMSQAVHPALSSKTSLGIGDTSWADWRSFRRVTSAEDCLWSFHEKNVNGTIESRLMQARFGECICRVPAPQNTQVTAGGQLTPGNVEGELRVGRFCDAAHFGFQIDGKDARTTGYCEWMARAHLPTRSAAMRVDAKSQDTGGATLAGAWNWTVDAFGSPAWRFEGDGRLELSSSISIGPNYTLAAWVNLEGFEPNFTDSGAVFSLFNSTNSAGISEPCLQLEQRIFLNGGAPYCAGDTPINITHDAAEELGKPTQHKDRWSLGLKACGSQTVWDSGADVIVPSSGNSNWVLLVATGEGDSQGLGHTTFYASSPEDPHIKEYASDFGCATAGCTATSVFRDIPRDPARTCVLSLSVWITNFLRGTTDIDPQVVEFISVRGGAPPLQRDIHVNCHPGADNQPNKSFECIHNYRVDDWIMDLKSDRALRIDVRASLNVSKYPKNGNLLSGFARVRCARTVSPDRLAPKSGTIRQIGKTARTCAGSVLRAIGGSTGGRTGVAPVARISQAWVWQSRLTDQEISSLHLGTRTRYYADYEVQLKNKDVITPGHEVKATGTLSCTKKGCTASTTLHGLPAAFDAKCYLTFDVAMTDFSSASEVVEWIKIDDQLVTENCWPQRDNDPLNFYRCLDRLDVSQTVMQASFLRDGAAEISAKISLEVDNHLFRRENKYYLYAEVEVYCVGFGSLDTQLFAQAVGIQPEATHVLAVSSNHQGEGALRASRFFDMSNGWIYKPRAIIGLDDRLQPKADISADVVYPDGQFWIYAVNSSAGQRLDKFDIISGLGADDVCGESHRRRGHSRFDSFKADSSLTDCYLQPGISYTLLLYVDRADPPYGGGQLVKLGVVGPYPPAHTLKPGVPLLSPRGVMFIDTNMLTEQISGILTIISAASEANITHYHVYYGIGSQRNSLPIAIVNASGAYQYSVAIHNSVMPQDTNTFAVYCKNDAGEAVRPASTRILDVSMKLTSVPLVERFLSTNGWTYVRIHLETSDALGRADVAVLPKGREVLAKLSFDYARLDSGEISRYVVCGKTNVNFNRKHTQIDVGPCSFAPGEAYAIVVVVGWRSENCACQDPCFCVGQLSTSVQAKPGGGLANTTEGFMVFPDETPPALSLYCGETCKQDTSLELTGQVSDIGMSYPVFSVCAACLPPGSELDVHQPPPLSCLRSGDSEAHRFWRMRIPAGNECNGRNSPAPEFYAISQLEPSGQLAAPHEILTNVKADAADKDRLDSLSLGYSGSWVLLGSSMESPVVGKYIADNEADTWWGIDMGSKPVAILRLRVHWGPAVITPHVCRAGEVYLDWSDDGHAWTPKLRSLVLPLPGQTYTDVFVNRSAAGWNYGAKYQVSFPGEGKKALSIANVTPGTLYHIDCWSIDSSWNAAGLAAPFVVQSADRAAPFVEIAGSVATDFGIHVDVRLQDPGKGYPAMSTCVARDIQNETTAQSLPKLEDLSSAGSRCHRKQLEPAPDSGGRIPMEFVFRSRLGNQTSRTIRIRQSQWGDPREDYMSCGLRQEPMNGHGGCGAMGMDKQPARFVFTIRAWQDIYFFLGGVGKQGYEIVAGDRGGLRVAVSRGYSRDPANANLPLPRQMIDYVYPNGDPMVAPQAFYTFWFEADPSSGLVRLGTDDIIGHGTLLSYVDPFPISALDDLMVGAGYNAAGPARTDVPDVYICPAIGNVLLNRKVESSSVAFGGLPSKAVDGQWGDLTFCEYCSADDSQHVCASTRRQDSQNEPWFRVDMGFRYRIGTIRLVAPNDGLPEQTSNLDIYVGMSGLRSDMFCVRALDARGDNLWPCDPQNPTEGRYVSIWGSGQTLSTLPEEFGMRICEVEAYVRQMDYTTFTGTQKKFSRDEGLSSPVPMKESHMALAQFCELDGGCLARVPGLDVYVLFNLYAPHMNCSNSTYEPLTHGTTSAASCYASASADSRCYQGGRFVFIQDSACYCSIDGCSARSVNGGSNVYEVLHVQAQALAVSSSNGRTSFSGTYLLQSAMRNGYPWWLLTSGIEELEFFSDTDGFWKIATSSIVGNSVGQEIMRSSSAHDNKMPESVKSWDGWDGTRWVTDSSIFVQQAPDRAQLLTVSIEGLQPNSKYEVFCYGEDRRGNVRYAKGPPLQITTTDNTAPKVLISEIHPATQNITVKVHLDDPGDSYPATARCIATADGLTPQEHEWYFQHRYWRAKFPYTGHFLDGECAGRILFRDAQLKSHGGLAFNKRMWSSDPDAEATLGFDTNGDGIGDVEETSAWNLPLNGGWIAIDLGHMEETERRVLQEGAMLAGDFSIGIYWEGSPHDLELSALGPGEAYTQVNLSDGDFYHISDFGVNSVQCWPPSATGSRQPCTSAVLAANFVLALPGNYEVTVYRQDAATEESTEWNSDRDSNNKTKLDITMTVMTRICGSDKVWTHTLPANELNTTIISNLQFRRTGCHRPDVSSMKRYRAWQSSKPFGLTAMETIEAVADGNPDTCIETGGEERCFSSRHPRDPTPWFRMSLNRTLNVKGVWLMGRPGLGIATMVDIWVSPSTTRRVGNISLDFVAESQQISHLACEHMATDVAWNNAKPYGMHAYCNIKNEVNLLFFDDCDCQRPLAIAHEATAEGSPYTRSQSLGPLAGQTFTCGGCPNGQVGSHSGCIGGLQPRSNTQTWQSLQNWQSAQGKKCEPIDHQSHDASRGAVYHQCCPQQSSVLMSTLTRCKGLCALSPGCSCVSYNTEAHLCFLRHECRLENCTSVSAFVTAIMPFVRANTSTTTTGAAMAELPEAAFLCAADVLVGTADPLEPPRPVACNEVVQGSTVWVVAKPSGKALALCEFEVFTEPIHTVTELSVDFGRANLTASICGAPNVTVEYSDDANTWLSAWKGSFNPMMPQYMQTARWPWWRRLFSLPFVAQFDKAGDQTIIIPRLREQTSYDVMCWAEDRLGNEITRDLVMLRLPWSQTRQQDATDAVQYPGAARRLATLTGLLEPVGTSAKLMCSSKTREIIPCEERVETSDDVEPHIAEAKLRSVQTTSEGYLTGATEKAIWEMRLRDSSCINRTSGPVRCWVQCAVEENDVLGFEQQPGSTCLGARCVKTSWSDARDVQLPFSMLRPGVTYTLNCTVTDAWSNRRQETFFIDIPKKTTLLPSSTQHRSLSTQLPSYHPTTTRQSTSIPVEVWQSPETTQGARDKWWPNDPVATLLITTTTALPTARMPPTRTVTSTPASPPRPSLPDWILASQKLGPLRTELTLGVTHEREAQVLTYPSSVQALKDALQHSLQLTSSDSIEINGMSVSESGSGGSQRRLAAWHVLVMFTVTVTGSNAHARGILERITDMGRSEESEVRTSLCEELAKQLTFWGTTMTPTVVGVRPLQKGALWTSNEMSSSPGPSTETAVESNSASTAIASALDFTEHPSSEAEEKTTPWLIPLIVGGICLIACLGFAFACCCAKGSDQAGSKVDDGFAGSSCESRGGAVAQPPHRPAQVKDVAGQPRSNRRPSAVTASPHRSESRSLERKANKPLQGMSQINSARTSRRSTQGHLTSRSVASQGMPRGAHSKLGELPVKEAWSTSCEQAIGSRCSTASGGSKAQQDSLRTSSHSSPPVSARAVVDPMDEVEVQSYASAARNFEVLSPSRLPLHGQQSRLSQSMDANDSIERPPTSGTSTTLS